MCRCGGPRSWRRPPWGPPASPGSRPAVWSSGDDFLAAQGEGSRFEPVMDPATVGEAPSRMESGGALGRGVGEGELDHGAGCPGARTVRCAWASLARREASGREIELATVVGAALARAGAVVVCGGRGGVMEAACRGAIGEGGLTVGILPGGDAAGGVIPG